MNNDPQKLSPLAIVIGIIVVAVIGLIIAGIVSSTRNNAQNQSTPETSNQVGATKENPSLVTTSDLSLTGDEFAEKYSGKYIAFDGLITGTNTLRGASSAHTQLVIGDDINTGSLADGSPFWITSGSTTFSDELMVYATDNNTPYETGVYPKVHVIAKVDSFNENNSVVQLEPLVNVDGSNPSVTAR